MANASSKQATHSSVLTSLVSVCRSGFTGKVALSARSGLSWRLYFGLGNLIWIDGGAHPNRSMYRSIKKFLPKLDMRTLRVPEVHRLECLHYSILDLLQHKGLLGEEQLKLLVTEKIGDDLFDILQQESLGHISGSQERKSRADLYEMGLGAPLFPIQVSEVCRNVETLWSAWAARGYASSSPNMAPFLKRGDELKQAVSEATYKNLVRLLDGTRTLRDLSALMGRDLLQVTHSLAKYLKAGHVRLIEIQDLHVNPQAFSESSESASELRSSSNCGKGKLVICIDDSAQICEVMELILSKAGYDYIGIQNPLNAIPVLMKRVPDLIYLDLMMPFLSGYELCTQIRKVSKLQDVPIVILTGNTGIFDRIRTKLLGVSKFMTKPFDKDEIISTTEEVLSGESMSPNAEQIAMV